MMHLLSSAVGLVAVVLYGYRTGTLLHGLSRGERVARVGVGLILTFVAVGFFQRHVIGAPFELIHWPIFAAFVVTVAGYVGMLWPSRRSG